MVMITSHVEYSYSSHGIHDQDWLSNERDSVHRSDHFSSNYVQLGMHMVGTATELHRAGCVRPVRSGSAISDQASAGLRIQYAHTYTTSGAGSPVRSQMPLLSRPVLLGWPCAQVRWQSSAPAAAHTAAAPGGRLLWSVVDLPLSLIAPAVRT